MSFTSHTSTLEPSAFWIPHCEAVVRAVLTESLSCKVIANAAPVPAVV